MVRNNRGLVLRWIRGKSIPKRFNLCIALVVGQFFMSCCTNIPLASPDLAEWEKFYRDDPKLAGVIVTQVPEGYYRLGYQELEYNNGHPGLVCFFFWNGAVRQILFTPKGDIIEDFYWKDSIENGDPNWEHVDFTKGSDSKFEFHRDPRRV